MRPEKLLRPAKFSIRLYDLENPDVEERVPWPFVRPDQVFMVIAVDLTDEQKFWADALGMKRPWVILFKERLWLVNVEGRTLMDLTPWAPWEEGYKHNSDLLETYRQFITIEEDNDQENG